MSPTAHPVIANKAAPNVSFYTPYQKVPSGTAQNPQSDGTAPPKLFTPLKIKGMTLQNRIFVSPMCQYSADNGAHTKWHQTHLGGIVQRGPGLTFVEATSVLPEGRITPEDSGLWSDAQMEPLRYSVEFAHSQNQHIAIQLGHAGRKASTVAPWLSAGDTAATEAGGWPDNVWAPSAIAYDAKHPSPHAMTTAKIEEFKSAFVASAQRAVEIGFDAIEIHAAHGYLLHEFFSPVSNHRTDAYGGSFENRIRILLETIDAVKPVLPANFPLFVRISATDWLDDQAEFADSWKLADSVALAKILAAKGIDLLDVSTGGIHPKQNINIHGPGYQSSFALEIKKAVGDSMLVTSVGAITDGHVAGKLVDQGLDAVMVGRYFQKNPGLVWAFAEDLGVELNAAHQIAWGFKGRAGGRKKETRN